MKREIIQKVQIPDGVEVSIDGSKIVVQGKEGKLEREFNFTKIEIKKEGSEIILKNSNSSKNEKRRINTIYSHLKNMILGVQEKFRYDLKICFAHFPITVEKKENQIIVKNFLGEKVPRIAVVPQGVEIETKKDTISVFSIDKELAGQAAANLESSTKIKSRDRRIFQDGIFLTSKAGKEI
jgi:large subunit ribosomal protein L6